MQSETKPDTLEEVIATALDECKLAWDPPGVTEIPAIIARHVRPLIEQARREQPQIWLRPTSDGLGFVVCVGPAVLRDDDARA